MATLDEIKRSIKDQIVEGMARTMWALAVADYIEERRSEDPEQPIVIGETELDLPRGPVDYDDVAPPTPPAAFDAARDLAKLIEGAGAEHVELSDLLEAALLVDKGEFDWTSVDEDDAFEFGSALAHQAIGTGRAWSDDHKTKTKAGTFELKLPFFECHLPDGQELVWSGSKRWQCSASVVRRIRISFERITPESAEQGDAEERGWEDEAGVPVVEEGEGAEIDDTLNFLDREAGGASLEPSSTVFHRGIWYTAYQHEPADYRTGEIVNRSFHLDGFSPLEEAWIFYFIVKKIGSIGIANTPSSSDSYRYRGRPRSHRESLEQNFVFWFGSGIMTPTYVLVFGNSLESAADEAVDYLEREGKTGLFADEEVNEEFERLVRQHDETGRPLAEILKEWHQAGRARLFEHLLEEAEVDTSWIGEHRLRIDEWGIAGEDLTLDELRKLGGVEVSNPPSKDAPRYERWRHEKAQTKQYHQKLAQRRADPRFQACDEACPGWAVFETGRGLAPLACDECNAIAKELGLPAIYDVETRGLPEARELMRRGETGYLEPPRRRRRNPRPVTHPPRLLGRRPHGRAVRS